MMNDRSINPIGPYAYLNVPPDADDTGAIVGTQLLHHKRFPDTATDR